ncbi:unnamed protein product [Prorocentrum cordatum]|uniref:Uncharacterized protein n=2 Tax=Prorocentrum cordatum TaxID=2364126 RepID=A0ABN9TRY6_9DINO|nr:unnamed protein product [Polarella glacialis]
MVSYHEVPPLMLDLLKHYLSCPKFRAICEEAIGFSRPAHPLGRLGLFGSTVDIRRIVFDIAVMRFTYHAAIIGDAFDLVVGDPAADPEEAEGRRRELTNRATNWSSSWLPSIFYAAPQSDFNTWLDWCVDYAYGVLHYRGFAPLFANRRFSIILIFLGLLVIIDSCSVLVCRLVGFPESFSILASFLVSALLAKGALLMLHTLFPALTEDKEGLITWLLLHPANLIEEDPTSAANVEIAFHDEQPGVPDDDLPVEAEDPVFLPLIHEVDNWCEGKEKKNKEISAGTELLLSFNGSQAPRDGSGLKVEIGGKIYSATVVASEFDAFQTPSPTPRADDDRSEAPGGGA